jgi:hypothetical protein
VSGASPAELVAATFDRLIQVPRAGRKKWSPAERAVWSIVTARTQQDLGGTESVFTDTSLDLEELVRALRSLGEPKLAAAWATSADALPSAPPAAR